MLIPATIRKKAAIALQSRPGLSRRIIFGVAALLFSATLLRADDIGDLQSKTDAWISKSKEIYRLVCDDMKHIWRAYGGEYAVTLERDRDAARRRDWISARRCKVDEFKPDKDRAKSKGEEQLSRYVPAVNQYYSGFITRKDTPDSDRGGSDIIKRIHENKECYEGDWPDGGDPNGEIRTTFKGEIRTYTPCENTYECTNP